MSSVSFHTAPNGALVLTADNELRSDLAHDLKSKPWDAVWTDLIEPLSANGKLYPVLPEWIGALTSAPILTDDLTVTDSGESVLPETALVWWYPNYAVTDPLAELAKRGRVVFSAA